MVPRMAFGVMWGESGEERGQKQVVQPHVAPMGSAIHTHTVHDLAVCGGMEGLVRFQPCGIKAEGRWFESNQFHTGL